MLDQHLTYADVARLLKIGRSTVFLWVRQGHLPKPEIYGKNCARFREEDIRAWQAQRASKNLADAAARRDRRGARK